MVKRLYIPPNLLIKYIMEMTLMLERGDTKENVTAHFLGPLQQMIEEGLISEEDSKKMAKQIEGMFIIAENSFIS